MPHTALGIPDRNQYGDLSKLKPGQLLDYVVQKHQAARAGLHRDIRLGGEDIGGLLSWAARKGVPPPGQRHLLLRQPQHSVAYKEFEGEIPAGEYGAGTVTREDLGKVLVTKVSPDSIHFTLAHTRWPERFALIKTKKEGEEDKKWLLVNTTPTTGFGYEKVPYANVDAAKAEKLLENLQPGSAVGAKIDGASNLTKLLKDKFEILSHRTSRVTGRPISYYEKFTKGEQPTMKVPPELVGTVLRGEIYGTKQDGEQLVPVQELGGVLNAAIEKSLATQKERKIQLRNLIYDIAQIGKKPVPAEMPYPERLKLISEVLSKTQLPGFHGQEVTGLATTPEEAKKLWKDISTGKHWATREGVVLHPSTGAPKKIKTFPEYDVLVRGFTPGTGKYTDKAIGALTYSDPTLGAEGPILGNVGSGYSDEVRKELMENFPLYAGRIARVAAQDRYPSGALRMPVFLGFHEDKPGVKLSAEQIKQAAIGPAELSFIGGLPAGLIAALIGARLAPKGDKLEGAGRGGFAGYMAGSSAGLGAHIGSQLAPVGGTMAEKLPYYLAGGLLGGTGGYGLAKIISGTPEWEKRERLKKELLQAVEDARIRSKEALAKTPSPLSGLLYAKAQSDIGKYEEKHKKLRELILQYPNDFAIDSEVGNIVGITHRPTRFRIHMLKKQIPLPLKRLEPPTRNVLKPEETVHAA